ncbi:hypothetical protein KAU33_15825 [Candidatus Dependentiae bacterium]|nr:hypothetical protein [Candidatus Dependentiae bacterium]
MRYVTLIKTAEENPAGKIIITSVIEKEYQDVEGLLNILTKELYVFAIPGRDHDIKILETRYASTTAVHQYLCRTGYAFKRPIGDKFFDVAGKSLATFTYECGYVDCWIDDPPRNRV